MAGANTPESRNPPQSTTFLVAVMLLLPAIAYGVGLTFLPHPTSVATARVIQDKVKLTGDVILKTSPSPKMPANANFGGKITVLGMDMPETTLSLGSRATMTFYFRANGEMQESWKVFMHIDAQGGRYRIHGDHFMPEGYGTEKWTKGDIIADRYALWVPLDAQKGVYDIWMGFYEPAHEDDRLPLVPGDATATDGQNRLKLGTLTVN